MDVLTFRDYCLSLPLTEESTPFDETTLVYKIGGKMYACADMVDFRVVAVKCEPDEALRLRELYAEVGPARHFNKQHWNGLRTDGDFPMRSCASRYAIPTGWSCGRMSRPRPCATRFRLTSSSTDCPNNDFRSTKQRPVLRRTGRFCQEAAACRRQRT